MTMIGQWDFTSEQPKTNRAVGSGCFGELELKGTAALGKNSGLTVNQDGWGRIPGLTAKILDNKTLIAWVLPSKTDAMTGGAAVSLFVTGAQQSDDRFDGLVFAEKQARTWTAGSDYFRRTDNTANAAATQSEFVNIQKIAATYTNVGANQVEVRLYVNDVLVSNKTFTTRQAYMLGASALLMGPRHLQRDGKPAGSLLARILAVEVHDAALGPAELASIARPGDVPGTAIIGVELPNGFSGQVDIRTWSAEAWWAQRTTVTCDDIGYSKQWTSGGTGLRDDFGQDNLTFPAAGRTYTICYKIEHRTNVTNPWQPSKVRKIQTATVRPNGDLVWLFDSEDGADQDYNDALLQITAIKSVSVDVQSKR